MQLNNRVIRNGSGRALWRGSITVMIGYFLSRLTGLLREIVISAQFGTCACLGAYRAAFKVTDLLYMVIIGGALGSSMIPVFIQVWERDGSRRAWALLSAVVSWAVVILGVASIAVGILAPWLVVWFYGHQQARGQTLDLHLTAQLIQLFLFSPWLLGLGGLAMAILNAREHFVLPALAPATYNLGIILGAWLFSVRWGIWGLAWGVIFGAALYLLIQVPGLRRLGMRVGFTWGRDLPELLTIARQMIPRVVGQAASQISIVVTAALTARLDLGGERLAGLDYAYQMMLLPYGLFSLSLSTVAFPHLARLWVEGRHEALAGTLRRTLQMIMFLTLPATVALVILGVPLARLLFQRGAFDNQSLAHTVIPLVGYATALPAFSCSEILIRSYYAMQRTWIPVLVGLLQVGVNLTLGSLALQFGGGVGMLAFAFSVANNIETVLLMVLITKYLPTIWYDRAFWRAIRAALLATVILAFALWGVYHASIPLFPFLTMEHSYHWKQHGLLLISWLAMVGGGSMIGYLAMTILAGSDDGNQIWKWMTRTKRQV